MYVRTYWQKLHHYKLHSFQQMDRAAHIMYYYSLDPVC